MTEKPIPQKYTFRGWYGNNTTIPPEEKEYIARQSHDLSSLGGDRCCFRGEEAEHKFNQEWGLAPYDRSCNAWMAYENVAILDVSDLSLLPLHSQRILRGKGRLSKSERNALLYKEKKAAL